MRCRLIATFLGLTALLLVALEVPLGVSTAMNSFHHLAIARLNETARLATLAAPLLAGHGDAAAFQQTIIDYDHRQHVAVVLVDRDGNTVQASRPGLDLRHGDWPPQLARALTGQRSDSLEYPYNVRAEPLFLAEPVEDGSEVLGAIATISPTTALRAEVVRVGGLLAAAFLIGLVAAAAISVLFARWILRPVSRLGETATAIAAGDEGIRAPTDRGPIELRTLARLFNSMADRLLALAATQRQFVADASHQMRNPLTALRLRVETLQPYTSHAGQRQLAAAVAETARLSKILDELLTLAREEAEDSTASVVDAGDVARQRVTAWQILAQKRGIGLSADVSATPVWCAPGTLDQVIDVFIDNALHCCTPGDQIAVTIRGRGDGVEVHVTDTGPGLSAADRAKAMDRFWRKNDRRDGNGLGLSIAAALLRASGGSLRLDAAPGGGLDAVAILPCPDPDTDLDTELMAPTTRPAHGSVG